MTYNRFLFGPLMGQQHDAGLPGSGDKKDDVVEDDTEVIDGSDSDEDSDEDEGEEKDLDEEELKNAKALFKMVKNPSTRDATLRALASSAGIKISDVETKAEVKAAKRSAKDVLTKHFPAEYKFLIPFISDSMEELLEQEREDTKRGTEELTSKQVETEVNTSRKELSRSTKGQSERFWPRMEELSGKLMPSGNMSTYEYLDMLYKLASHGKTASNITQNINEKINRNAKDAPSRMHSKGQGGGSDKTDVSKMTTREAISYALAKQGINQK